MAAPPTIRIESIAHGGDGVGTLESGKRIFVPLTAPGDLVDVQLVSDGAQHARGTISRVVEAGANRVEPRCAHAAACGGCQLQQLSGEAQLRAKEQAFYEALARLGDCPRDAIEDARPIVASPLAFRYRIRCRLNFSKGELGHLRRGTHELEALRECHLLVPELEALALRVAAHLRARPIKHLSAVEICVGEDGSGAAALEPTTEAPPSWGERAGELLSIEGLRGVVVLPAAGAPVGEGVRLLVRGDRRRGSAEIRGSRDRRRSRPEFSSSGARTSSRRRTPRRTSDWSPPPWRVSGSSLETSSSSSSVARAISRSRWPLAVRRSRRWSPKASPSTWRAFPRKRSCAGVAPPAFLRKRRKPELKALPAFPRKRPPARSASSPAMRPG
ncbi:23S rRNA (Uracil-5-) -methyltransferase RumA [Vulgatibacter incomptus]|uniref:23S rRNA (Uracil-5-)-methyltransferase RumA n=1 Tax=Vulgatibacter incomptus TaxID=1391653 RepID=A0A0K1PBC0_9BACT|nr:23S rRNA (Uracil-5-) -methyltransferase RumA [Vulgatibacter incomptus]